MTCRAIVVVGLLLSGCFDDVPVIEVSGNAGTNITPLVPVDATDELATYRWEVVESVEGSFVSGTSATTPRASFQFDRRGQYLIDRWIVSGLSERLTHHVVVTIRGVPPRAMVDGTRYLAVNETARFEGGTSSSFEDRPLSYRWQLAERPGPSQANFPPDELGDVMPSLVPDVAGNYIVELRVFDGELWSEPAAIQMEAHD